MSASPPDLPASASPPPTTPLGSFLPFETEGPQSNSSKLPRRFETDPKNFRSTEELKPKAFKRIVVCCDGTWQDGICAASRATYTNVLRLSRAIDHVDERFNPPIPQIVYYQSGVGTEDNLFSKYIEGATGSSLASKVEEAYAFIAHNYSPGDEIFLFGFSRGAYTARMVAMFIGEIGVLDRRDMDYFGKIFFDYQALPKCKEQKEKKSIEDELNPWRKPDARGKLRAYCDKDTFTIKCLGVWDTVGALGLPGEFTQLLNPEQSVKNLFGFPDHRLGEHIERAYQALALNEIRKDFDCTKFKQTEGGRRKNQTLKQCWFTGCHSDIGGGYEDHDLTNIAMTWMAAQISDTLSLDPEYLKSFVSPVAPWGKQQPHNSAEDGIFMLASTSPRKLPSGPNDPQTCETIHASVLEQSSPNPELIDLITKHPNIISPLLPLEEELKSFWPYDPTSDAAKKYASKLKISQVTGGQNNTQDVVGTTRSWFRKSLFRSISRRGASVKSDGETTVRLVEQHTYQRQTDRRGVA